MYVYMCCVCELHMLRGFGGGGVGGGFRFFYFNCWEKCLVGFTKLVCEFFE